MAVIAIDFEASCLPRHGRSYPIEVGIADASGRSQSWLIQPHRSWDGWDWTQEAENLHGITQGRLLRDGQPAAVVAAELFHAIRGHRLIADSMIDGYWLETLAAAAGTVPPARIEVIGTVLDELGSTTDEIVAAQAALERQNFRRHRAGDDARWLFALIKMLTDISTARGRGLEERQSAA